MADVRRYPLVRHLRAEPTSHLLRYRNGAVVAQGRGLAFWFRPLRTAVVEIPIDDRELEFHFGGRSSDFQDVTVQGAVAYRVDRPEALASRIDFTLDLATGRYRRRPLEQLGGLLTQIAQGLVWGYLVATPLETLLTTGVDEIRRRLAGGLADDPRLAGMGVAVSSVDVLAVRPTPEVERALQVPRLEQVQQLADKATFERRASAVEQERAIGANELATRIELARREEELVAQEAENARRRAEGRAAEQEVEARSEAARIVAVEGARVETERARTEVYAGLPGPVLRALTVRDVAEHLPAIDHLTLAPELVTPLLSRLVAGSGDG
jgi:regulator of protease activity HflC (stomatin/prohibitin superfamily)